MNNKKVLAIILSVVMLLGTFTNTFAATDLKVISAHAAFTDVTNHWGADAIHKWSGYGIINGNNGLFRPDDFITRGEIAVILDNMMDYQIAAENSFTDLKAGKFYTEAILKANAAGVIDSNGSLLRPMDNITREEAAVILGKAFAIDETVSGTSTFDDAAKIATWATGYVTAMQAKGYVKGFNNNFLPKTYITRAEIVKMIDNIVKAYYIKAGTYTDAVNGIAVIKVPSVTLKGVTISENLIIAEGVGQGEVTLDSVTVKGKTIVRGGGENSVHIVGTSSLTRITIEKKDGKLRIAISDGNLVQEIEVAEGEEIIITGTVGSLDIDASNATVYATDAAITKANITGENSTLVVDPKSKIVTLTISGTGENAKVQTQEGSEIGTIIAEASTNVSGKGKVSNVDLKSGADDSSVTTPNTKTSVTEGVTGVTGGGGKKIAEGNTEINNAAGDDLVSITDSGTSGGSTTVVVSAITVKGEGNATSIKINCTLQMSATITPANATNQTISWRVDPLVAGTATINSTTGLLTATGVGTVTVTATNVASGIAGTAIVTVTLSSDATLSDSSSVKEQTIASLGTPNTTLASVVAGGSVIISNEKAADTSNLTTFITLFNPTDIGATVKVVKYAVGSATTNFATDSAYNMSGAITNGDFFIIRVTDGNGNILYYKITATVTATTAEGDFTFNAATGTITNYNGTAANVIIPSTIGGVAVTAIDNGAFSNNSLETISVPNSVISILPRAFTYCANLTSLNLDASNPNYSSIEGVLFNKAQTTLISYSRGKVGAYSIPAGVTIIGQHAFANSNNLNVITIPDSVTNIEYAAFAHCYSLVEVTIPDSVTSLGGWAFGDCRILAEITIPASVTSIGDYAFYLCEDMTSINVAATNPNFSSLSGVLFNKDKTTLITYPGGKTGTYSVPNSVTRIGKDAFNNCTNLIEIVIPTSVSTIGDSAFYLSGITDINLPDSVTSIEYRAFMYTALTEITIPASVTSIGAEAFRACSALTTAYFEGNAPAPGSFGEHVFTENAWYDIKAGFMIRYHVGATGFTNPWNGYTTGIY